MSEYPHPGFHPDADSLNAFIEGVLPEHERLECLAHLGDCARCREIVYLAQEPVEAVSLPADPVPFWKRWFTPIPVLAVAVVCVLLVSLGVYRVMRAKTVEPVLTAVATPPVERPAPLSEPLLKETPKSTPIRKPVPPVQRPVTTAPPPPALPTPVGEPQFAALSNPTPQVATAGIAGTVTDAAGVVVPGAVVTVRPVTGVSNLGTRTDNKGQYTFAGLMPGQYELQFVSPGFKETKKQIEIQPQLVAKADSRLEVGAATETVTVNAEASLLKTESGVAGGVIAGRAVSALPLIPLNTRAGPVSQLPATPAPSTTASKDKLMLKIDSAGALFFSKNAGKSWKAVKPGWRGNVVRVESTHDPAAVFQLTTDSGSVWLSRDGTHWNPAPR